MPPKAEGPNSVCKRAGSTVWSCDILHATRPRRCRRQLNWEPQVNLEDGLRLTLDFFRRQVAATI